MKLTEMVVEEAILPDLKAGDRDAAISELMNALVAGGAVKESERDEFCKAIIKRERRGSTGFGHGVAVPHVKHTDIDRMVIAVGVSHEGIDFNALDNQPVYSIFLLLSPENRPEDHLDAMEAIFGNLKHDTFRRFLRQARNVDDVMTLLGEADAKKATIR
jgi:PTS system fructose-specific IIA component/PTS system nitrogen regulatory IIA component